MSLYLSPYSRAILSVAILLACRIATAQEFRNSIASTDFDFITADDPSTFKALKFVRRGRAEMPDKRGERELFQDAYEFSAGFSDGTRVAIFIDSRGKEEKAAKKEALRFVHPLGKLPTSLRSGLTRLCVHSGGKTTTAFADKGLIVLYSDNASVRISNHDLEETVFHESVHASWDPRYARSEAWQKAQMRDSSYVTIYARSKPEREDLAETALFAYTILHHPERLPAEVREDLQKKIYHRIRFIEQLLPTDRPIHYSIDQVAKGNTEAAGKSSTEPKLWDVRRTGIAADIISHSLMTELGVPETKVSKFLANAVKRFESPEELFAATIAALNVDSEMLREAVLKNLYANSGKNRPDESTEVLVRKAVRGWKVDQ